MINAHGLNLADAERDTISTDAFMTTSENAYAVTEDSQTEGTYTLGAVATETISSSDGTSDEEDSGSKEMDLHKQEEELKLERVEWRGLL